MDIVGIDRTIVERVARIIKNHKNELPRLDLFDSRFYPPRDADPEDVSRYFIVMVALDHRLSRPGKQYYACLENECYKGADLLYRLGMKKYIEEPDFYSPGKLSGITVTDVKNMLTADNASPPDVEVRTILLRDLGLKLMKLYDSSVLKLLSQSNNRLRGEIDKPGLVDNLRVFRAYEDPVEKKSMLLAKFLIARGLFNPIDKLDVAVDNHLARIAYRLGLVMVSGILWEKIKNNIEVSYEEDILLRLLIRRAYRQVAEKSGVNVELIDDYFWIMGRSICLRDAEPLCQKCLFKGFCRARRNNAFMSLEPINYNTWYY